MDRKIYAIDFDGTLCENAWPDIGPPKEIMIRWVKNLQQQGHKIILWTCREGMPLVNALVWCADHGLFFDAVNDNLEEQKVLFGDNSRKIYADTYVDDKSVHPNIVSICEKNYNDI